MLWSLFVSISFVNTAFSHTYIYFPPPPTPHPLSQLTDTGLPGREPDAEGRGGTRSGGGRDVLLRLPPQEDNQGGRRLGRGRQALETQREAHGVIFLSLGLGGDKGRREIVVMRTERK